MKIRHFSACLLMGLLLAACEGEMFSESITEQVETPHRIGPVSQYGQLMAGAPDGIGHIYGSCKGAVSGSEVQVRGMSLYWSLLIRSTDFYSEPAITSMVRDMKIEVVRAAIATEENWGGYEGYFGDSLGQLALIDQVVYGAVKNDIYVIIDWHSHTATDQYEKAAEFFDIVSKRYGHLDNVIFEVFNEPKKQTWADIKAYADSMVAVIRKHSDNLILVGNPYWDQQPNRAIGNEVADSLGNVAYTFHYYANTHTIASQGKKAELAMNAGLPVFVSEWGTGNADGGGTPDLTKNQQWQDWLNTNKLSSANWSASQIDEGTAAFTDEASPESLVFSESGLLVKEYLSLNPDSYVSCGNW